AAPSARLPPRRGGAGAERMSPEPATMTLISTEAAQDSPPPMPEACLRHDGEGMGAGVSSGTNRSNLHFASRAQSSIGCRQRGFTPPLAPPHQGEGNPIA